MAEGGKQVCASGNAVAQGYVGQVINAAFDTAINSPASNTWYSSGGLPLTPGVWLVTFMGGISGLTGLTAGSACLSTTQTSGATGDAYFTDGRSDSFLSVIQFSITSGSPCFSHTVVVNIVGNTTFYVRQTATFSSGSSPSYYIGRMRGVRIA